MKTLRAMESLVEDVPQVNFVICPAAIEDCDRIFELVQVRFLFDFYLLLSLIYINFTSIVYTYIHKIFKNIIYIKPMVVKSDVTN